ncbi:MAG: hypothetical protein ACPGCU_02165, partial [Candidatus Poseidoniaceae archaeon]
SNGGIDWEEGWSFPFSTTIGDMLMDGTTIYISTSGNGLYVLDTTTGTLQRQTGSIHNSLGGLAMHQVSGVSTLYVGLLGTFSTAAGVQAFDVATQQFGAGQLLSGLPSDNIQGFAVSMTTFTLLLKTESVAGTCLQTIGTTRLRLQMAYHLRTLKISSSFQTHSTSHLAVV